VIRTYGPIDEAALSQALKRTMPEKEKEKEMLSIAAREWLAQGEAKGKAEGEAKALLRVLERRFGEVAAEVREVISRAASDELEAWLDKAIDAPSIEAVFGPSAH
jgi:flagellar biosynthesis/type III secretory pathway protein FliH